MCFKPFIDNLFKIHIVLALYHTVIQFTALIGFSAKAFFKFRIRRNNAVTPAVLTLKLFAYNTIQLFGSANIKHSFAIRRICDKSALFGCRIKLCNIANRRTNELVYLDISCVLSVSSIACGSISEPNATKSVSVLIKS